jgi:antitoxin ChpS
MAKKFTELQAKMPPTARARAATRAEAMRDAPQLSADAKLGLAVDGGNQEVDPTARPRYALDELLAQCNPSNTHLSAEDREWLNARPVGRESL